ncbi:MAG: NTP transferase domain-containing protein [Candidatus Woesebacteria bacterium]|nr:MAG: NTP transferase domain-containing protein [Candidatus Woesebacteria bacterium]
MGKIIGITDDSRKVKPGMVFVAVKGKTTDGHNYIEEALKNGAEHVFGEMNFKNSKYTKVSDSRQKLGDLASEFYENPSKKLKIIGVTGTKGKTTTTHIIYHILTALKKKAGMVSSNMARIGNKEVDTGFHVTSPDVISLHKFLKEMVDAGCEYAVIEVSSHGIDQKRIAGVDFEVGVLTNIAPEHLDYHKTFREYRRVKMSFVNSCKFKVIAPKETTTNILPGKFNNLNVDVAVETVTKLGFDRKKALGTLESFELPKGRLDEIKNNLGFRIVIDFAHTPDSLEAVLTYLRSERKGKGKLISVFGCAGERDIKKRFKMGKVSVKLADFSVFTAEDPRSEDVNDILAKMVEGAKSVGGIDGKNFVRIPLRGEAVAFALSIAKKGDIVGFFGKGHETSMAYSACDASSNACKRFEHPWSDRTEIENYLHGTPDVSAVILAAGKGTRMRSQYPKVIHEICGRPMVSYTLENLRKAGIIDITAVVSFRKNLVINRIKGAVKIAYQKNPKGGTADAAKAGFKLISPNTKTLLIINGDDSAFYTPETIKKILEIHTDRERKLTFVSLMKENPTGLGRVIRRPDGLIAKIVEEKDATDAERKINEVNDGLYVFDKKWFSRNIEKVKKSAQGEYYLVDLIKLAIDQGDRMATYTLPNDDEWQGINTPEQLAEANRKMDKKLKGHN